MKQKKSIVEINKVIDELRAEKFKLEQEDKEKNQYPAIQKLIGTCYKYRNNYSCPSKPSDYWWYYVKVVAAKKETITMLAFQTDSLGNCEIKRAKKYLYHDSLLRGGYIPIKASEYNKQLKDIIKRIGF